MRTIKDAFERRYGHDIKPEDHVIPWMVQHAAAIINRYHKPSDGLTAYRKVRGKDYRGDICEFGEGIWYMEASKPGKHKFDSKWHHSVWLGIMDGSGEKIIGTAAGCVKARSIKRKPEAERWDVEMMKSLRGTPWEVVPGHKDRALRCRVIMDRTDRGRDVPGMPEEPEEIIRRIYITKKDLMKYGRTEGCPGCRASLREGESKPHSKECRERIEKEMRKMKTADTRVGMTE